MKIKKIIKTTLATLLMSSLALSSSPLPREYDGVKLGSDLSEVRALHPEAETGSYSYLCGLAGISPHINYCSEDVRQVIPGLGVTYVTTCFCFPKKVTVAYPLSAIVIKYDKVSIKEGILELIEESKEKYGPPLKESDVKKGVGFCHGMLITSSSPVSDYNYKEFEIIWEDNQTKLKYSVLLREAPEYNPCRHSILYKYIIDKTQ